MLRLITDPGSIRYAERRIAEIIYTHSEWLCVVNARAVTSLRNSECDVRGSHGRLILSCWGVGGSLAWRITGWEWTSEKFLFEAQRRFGAERVVLELIPRTPFENMTATITATRRDRCQRLAQLACELLYRAKIERAALSPGARKGQPGRYARIVLRHQRERIAVTGSVVDSRTGGIDAFLSTSLIWFGRASEKARPPFIQKLWLVVHQDFVEALSERLALLRDDLRRVITLYSIDEAWQQLNMVELPTLDDLWAMEPRHFRRPSRDWISESAERILSVAPDAIDVVRSRYGETLRYHGLAFARVRRVMNKENVWFGTEGGRRRLLCESREAEWKKLLSDLIEHRRDEPIDQHHTLYKAAPEAWLESLLRRDITRLDPGLRLAPLYAQLRPSHEPRPRPIDLLALRHDGRLAVIELKVSEDREHVVQGADYWRRIALHHRYGHIRRADLFPDAEIEDEPPLVYLVAPLLRFHRAFKTLARAISPIIQIYRFDINEDWRSGVRVMRRSRANG